MISLLVMVLGFAALFLKWHVTCIFWGWFIAPVFSLPILTYWQAAGVSYTFAVFSFAVRWGDLVKHNNEDHVKRHLTQGLVLLMGWGIGYLIHLVGSP